MSLNKVATLVVDGTHPVPFNQLVDRMKEVCEAGHVVHTEMLRCTFQVRTNALLDVDPKGFEDHFLGHDPGAPAV